MFKKLFLELRRREVFRTAGLYIGISWIVIEVASVLLPAFDMPEAVLQGLVYLAVAGFPISLVLAWIFDISDKGIVVQEDTDEAVALPVGGYKMDFVVIGVLSLALIVSLYQNFSAAPEAGDAVAPKTVLLADIENNSANSSLDEAITQALIMGLETTPSISLQNALDRELQPAPASASVAAGYAVPAMAPQDAQLVISGSVIKEGSGLRITLRVLDQASGETIFEDDAKAAVETDLLPALDDLLAGLRDSIGARTDAPVPTFRGDRAITQSLAALQSFSAAETLMRSHEYPAALQQYQRAAELDPQFARARYGAAFAAYASGQDGVARELWQEAEKLQARIDPVVLARLRARYFTTLQPDYAKAIAQYEQLVTILPANAAALQALARLYRATGQHDKAFASNSALLALSPQSMSLRTGNAEYALYANDFELATAAATELHGQAPELVLPPVILAIAALHRGDVAAATAHYKKIADGNAQGASVASSGLADIALFERRYDDALTLLTAGLAADRSASDEYGVASKTAMLAEVYVGQQANAAALQELQALPQSAGLAQLVQAAAIHAAGGRAAEANAIAAQLREQAAPSAQAYADMIVGLLAQHDADHNAAIDAYRRALRKADLWLVRFHIAEAYLQAGYPAEASDEFSKCLARRGEAGLLFFDGLPTWRYTAGLAERKAAADREFLRQSAAP